MADDGKREYNGWTYWHTWNANLWLNTNKAVYEEARRIAGCGRTQRLRELAVHNTPGNEGIDYNEVNWGEIEAGLLED